MRQHPWLFKRGSIYYMRAIVPVDLHAALGKREIWKSLRTSDRQTANLLVQTEAAKISLEFEILKKRAKDEPVKPSKSQLEFIAADWAGKLDSQRNNALPISVRAEGREGIAYERGETHSLLEHYSSALKSNEFSAVAPEVDKLIRTHNLQISQSSEEWKTLAYLVLRAIKRDLSKDVEDLDGEPSKYVDPLFDIAPGKSRPRSAGETISTVIEKYKRVYAPNWVGKTKFYYDVCFKLLIKFFGQHQRIAEISRDQLREYRETLRRLPPNHSKFKALRGLSLQEIVEHARASGMPGSSEKTVQKYTTMTMSIFRFAEEESIIEKNPAVVLRALNTARKRKSLLETDKPNMRLPWSSAQLERLFSSEEFRNLPVVSSLRWVPLIAVFHGIRLNEICQLEVGDVKFIENVPSIKVTNIVSAEDDDLAEGREWKPADNEDNFGDDEEVLKRVKNTGAVRDIPIHPNLISAGFLKLWERARNNGQHRIFEDIPVAKSGYYSDIFSKRFSRFKEKILHTGRRVTFHSFRHNFRDACRNAGVSTELALALGGWSEGDNVVGNNYGAGFSITVKLDAIRKISYPSIRIQTFDDEDFLS
jgi:integrase